MYIRITLSHFVVAVLLIAQPPVKPVGQDVQCSGHDCGSVERGLHSFLDREVDGLRGNGRACADCHMPTNSFQLSPVNVEARYQSLQFRRQFDRNADDPLFRPIDADDYRIHGANASDFTTLRRNGLIRISLPLPANVKLIDPATNQPSSETFVDVWRAVPSVNNVALTGPDGHVFVNRGPTPEAVTNSTRASPRSRNKRWRRSSITPRWRAPLPSAPLTTSPRSS